MDKQKHIKRRRYKTFIPIFLLFGMAGICLCAAVYFKDYNKEAYDRQEKEESLADDFINDLLAGIFDETLEAEEVENSDETIQGTKAPGRNEPETEDTILPTKELIIRDVINDDIYLEKNGITYTPDYAVGEIQFVLEYPACKIRRGVYTGTWEEIAFDLDIWMATAARPDYKLGKTHICIYGHNHTSQNLSFNNLKNASYGDEFVLYAKNGVYFYEVTNIFCESRDGVSRKYIHNFNIDKDKCYIVTCGRDNFLINGQSTRYRDFVVEGTLKKYMTLREYKEVYAN